MVRSEGGAPRPDFGLDAPPIVYGYASVGLVGLALLGCLALHNLHPVSRRDEAVREALRVLRPGGRLALVDIARTKTYVTATVGAGGRDVRRSGFVLGIFPPARVVTGSMPPARG